MTQEQLKEAQQLYDDIKEAEGILKDFESMVAQEFTAGRMNSANMYRRFSKVTEEHLSELQDKFKTL